MAGESICNSPQRSCLLREFFGISSTIMTCRRGDRLPAERVLCEEIGVSRTALRAGITRLISCGTLESRRGSGTYVCPPKPLNIFQETYNFSACCARLPAQCRPLFSSGFHRDHRRRMRRSGRQGLGSIWVGRSFASDMQRVRLIEGEPASIETAHVNLSLCPSLTEHDFECESLYDVLLKEGGVRVDAWTSEHISISPFERRRGRAAPAQKRERRCSMRASH